jgi:hypothetical protein
MLLRQRRAGPAVREQRILSSEIRQCQIGRVAVIGMQHDEVRRVARPAGGEQIARRQPLPLIVVARPGRHAMDVGDELALLLGQEGRHVPEQRIFDRAIDVEPPAL